MDCRSVIGEVLVMGLQAHCLECQVLYSVGVHQRRIGALLGALGALACRRQQPLSTLDSTRP